VREKPHSPPSSNLHHSSPKSPSLHPCSGDGDEDPAEAAGAGADPLPDALRSVPAAKRAGKPTALAPAKGGQLQARGVVAPAPPKCGSRRRALPLPAGEARLSDAAASAAGTHGRTYYITVLEEQIEVC
jgi:hypothetical protein